MDTHKTLSTQLTQLLLDMKLDQRYYNRFEAHRDLKTTLSPTEVQKITADTLTSHGINAKYDKKENFFRFEEQRGEYKFVSTIAFSYFAKLELLFAIHTASDSAGGTIHSLARNVARQHTPDFEYAPRYPRIPFGDAEELADAVNFSLALFNDIKQAVLDMDTEGSGE